MNESKQQPEENKLVRSKVLRLLFLILGFISLGLGAVGIFLPALPTVPFYLLSAFCLVRGSKRFAGWFSLRKTERKESR